MTNLIRAALAPVDARIPAAFRVSLGLVVLSDLVDRLRDAFTFYSDQGVLGARPPGASLQRWSLLAPLGSPAGTVVFFGLAFVVVAAFTVGYRTRVAAVLTWVLVHSLQMRNLLVCDGGDALIRVLCFWTMFVDTGARFSLDVRLGRRPPLAAVPGLPVRLVQVQIAVVYLAAGLSKNGPAWIDGTAVFYAVQGTDFGRPLGAWLARAPALCTWAAFATRATELAFAPLVLWPSRRGRLRAAGLVSAGALHIGILATMRVGVFSVLLPASYAIFLRPSWIDALLPGERPAPGSPRRPGVVEVALSLQMLLVLFSLTPAARLRWVGVELGVTGLWQSWTMFAPEPSRLAAVFSAPGHLTDGTEVDVLARAAPMMLPHPGFFYSRWFKYRLNLALGLVGPLEGFGRYLCRRYNGDWPGARLARFSLVLSVRPIPAPGAKPGPWQAETILRQSCSAP